MSLTDGQLQALRNLADKSAGGETSFLNISDAQHLTELGLAQRSRQGWDITPAGARHLATLERAGHPGATLTVLRTGKDDDGAS